MASCWELDLGTLAFHESVTECAFGSTGDDALSAEALDTADAHGGTTCADAAASAAPFVEARPLTWAMPLIGRERTAASVIPRILIGFEERLTDNLPASRILKSSFQRKIGNHEDLS